MHEGHRQRLRKRFLEEGLEGFEEHEILELMLFYALPRIDTNKIAHQLIDTFGSLSGVLEADARDLASVPGIGNNAAAYLSMFPDLFRAYHRNRLGERPLIRSIKDACAFAEALLFGKSYEQFYVIWLNTQGRVIHYERLSEGGLSESPVYLNKLAAAALRHHAAKGLVAHNHPGGSVTPSKEDIHTTQRILQALKMLDIELVDHIIVGNDSSFSFQADSLMGRKTHEKHDAYAAEYAGVCEFSSVMEGFGSSR